MPFYIALNMALKLFYFALSNGIKTRLVSGETTIKNNGKLKGNGYGIFKRNLR